MNMELRILVMTKGIYWKDIAERLGMSKVQMSRALKKPLLPGMEKAIRKAISELSEV